jgi:hypothetical protein
MKTIRIALMITAVVLVAVPASAQNWFWGVTWGLSVPTDDFREYIDKESWRNFGLEGRKFVSSNQSVGLSFNWSVFNQETREATTLSGTTIAGDQFRYVNAFPLLLTMHQYIGDDEGMQLHLGVGVGTSYIERRTEVGLWAFVDKTWHLHLAPEVGFTFPMGWRTKAFIMGRYNLTSETQGYQYSWLDIRVGIVSL